MQFVFGAQNVISFNLIAIDRGGTILFDVEFGDDIGYGTVRGQG